MRGYYFITDSALSLAGSLSDVGKAVAAGVTIVQYREKSKETRPMVEEALAMMEICRRGGARLIINDRIDVALAVGADGVHLGQDDMPYATGRRLLGKGAVIGITVHDLEEAIAAEQAGADYLGVSPVFATATKQDAGRPCGTVLITEIKRNCRIPVVAIGGISHDNAPEVIRAGADMVCAISAVVTRPDVAVEVNKFQRMFTP